MRICKSFSFALASVLPAAGLLAGCGNGGVPAVNPGSMATTQSLGECGASPLRPALPVRLSRIAAAICSARGATRSSTLDATTQRMPAASSESLLYRFMGPPADGAGPADGFITDATGALYGTTVYGGKYDKGTVYKLTPKGSVYVETILYSFKGGNDGTDPGGSLIADSAGTLYGTTTLGGNLSCANALGKGCGTVFALTRSGARYAKRTLYMFKGYPSDGTQPDTLVADATGALYGTTSFGGNSKDCSSEGPGCGVAYKLSPLGKGYKESVLHSFNGGHDGLNPNDGLLIDSTGTLYGTTFFGGEKDNGIVFRLAPSKRGYAESILYSFKSSPDGAGPNGGLIVDRAGTLYGTTLNGGTGCPASVGCGVAFALRRNGSSYVETILYTFAGSHDASFPSGGLLAGKGGTLYGNSADGGSAYCFHSGCGAVYELVPSGKTYTDRVLYGFKGGPDGQFPVGTLLRKGGGRLYGTTNVGGKRDYGTAFSVMP